MVAAVVVVAVVVVGAVVAAVVVVGWGCHLAVVPQCFAFVVCIGVVVGWQRQGRPRRLSLCRVS